MAQVFIVTGAASGIGRHLVSALARRGHSVLATDLSLGTLSAASAQDGWPAGRVRTSALDVRDPGAWRHALETACEAFGHVDVLLSVAGFLRPGFIQDTTVEDVDLHFDVNVKGIAHGLRVVGGYFAGRGRGHVVNFGSLSSLAPVSGLTLYSASKFAVRGLSLAAARDLEPHGVAVTVVLPDAVATPMLDVQVDRPEAALTFSGPRPLTVQDIERLVFDTVLVARPLEVAIPWERGLLARLASTVPQTVAVLAPMLERKGRAAQKRYRRP